MACLTSLVEPLRAANEIVMRPVFAWTLLSERASQVSSSANIGFEVDASLRNAVDLDAILLLGAPTSRFVDEAAGHAALHDRARRRVTLGGISGGVFPLVRSGVMAGRPVSVHWCYDAAFRATFPDAQVSDEVIVSGRGRHTVSGAGAAFDLGLRLIEERLNAEVAHEVACWFQHPQMRGEGVRQRVPLVAAPDGQDDLPDLVRICIARMAQDLEAPVSVADLARHVGVTSRQVGRAFVRATGQSPSRYYRGMRMKAARQMVLHSRDLVADIAAAVGYGSPAAMAPHYRAAFGCSPAEDRARINRYRVEGNVSVPS
ncbi:GlxA family transcriptional regulator [Jannaschia sp. LMIT008]|uniref:GlxA family transcriptional regulator n=1 Tax=Jannaschia maritima TaxID=3032585 RepID=UPI00281142B7|nr:helix-turn-helix domain-containing protein [Jannaschia sp. LMIT008]